MKCSFCVFVNKFEKIYEESFYSVDIMVTFCDFPLREIIHSKSIWGWRTLFRMLPLWWKKNVWSLMKIASKVWKLWLFFKVLKGRFFIKVYYRVMSFRQNVTLVMVNKFVKFDEKSLSFVKVMAEICWKRAVFQNSYLWISDHAP